MRLKFFNLFTFNVAKGRRNKETNMKKIRTFEEFVAAMSSKTRKDRKMQIFYSELNHSVEPDGFALSLLNYTMPDWIKPSLKLDMVEALRGYNEEVALEIVDDLMDCWTGLGLHVTGLKYVDELLGRFYTRIIKCAEKKGVVLEYRL